jgi:hypothetical protein
MVIGIAAQEHHAAFHHRLGIDVGDPQAEDAGVKRNRPLHVAHLDHDMAELRQVESPCPAGGVIFGAVLRLRALQSFQIDDASGHAAGSFRWLIVNYQARRGT